MSTANLKEKGDWLRLQTTIFTRWVNQKLSARHLKVDNIVTALGDGTTLINLLEILTEKEFGKYDKAPKLRVNKIDNIGRALKFAKDAGVSLKVFPQAEDLVDGKENLVLGLVWAIILRFMKVGDEEDSSLSPKDALLLWVKNQTQGYPGVNITDSFSASFKDGLALCALLHKYRPNLVPYDTLNKEDVKRNLEVAFDAAQKYFDLDKYLTPDEFLQLNEVSLTVYVNEYYQGIASQRKLDLAARRIANLIQLTQENDARKLAYNAAAAKLKQDIAAVQAILADRTIDNTYDGAKRRIEQFYEYKRSEKSKLIEQQLALESQYNMLALKLAQHRRPVYRPPAGLDLKDIEAAFAQLEASETERNVALHAELNRQLRLISLNGQHEARQQKILAWAAEKENYLKTKEDVQSVSAGQLQLKLLESYEQDNRSTWDGSVAALKRLGAELAAEKYEHIANVVEREKEVDAKFSQLAELAKNKRAVLEDDLARETFKVKLGLQFVQHTDAFERLKAWVAEKQAYLTAREPSDGVPRCQQNLSVLDGYLHENKDTVEAAVVPLKQLGIEIIEAKYETALSSYRFPPDEILARHREIDADWARLADLEKAKRAVLEDDLARETFKVKLGLLFAQHTNMFRKLKAWVAEKEAYLNTKEPVDSVSKAQLNLSVLERYEKENAATVEGSVNPLKRLGKEIVDAKYETVLSSYRYPPEELHARAAEVDADWSRLAQLAKDKRAVLEDDLARELFKERLALQFAQHTDLYRALKQWVAEKEAYLRTTETVQSVDDAQSALNALEAYEKDNAATLEGSVAQIKALGSAIVAAEYRTSLSSYKFPPEELHARAADIDADWARLAELNKHKRAVLEDDLARELFKERLHLQDAQHTAAYQKLLAWVSAKEEYLKATENSQSVSEAQLQLSRLLAFDREWQVTLDTRVAALKRFAAEIIAAEYRTSYSSYKFPPQAVEARGPAVDAKFTELAQLAAAKRKVLEADLAREQHKEELRLSFASLARDAVAWVSDTCETTAETLFGSTLDEVEAFLPALTKSDAELLATWGAKKEAAMKVWQALQEQHVTENVYTTLKPADLDAAEKQLHDALGARRKSYEGALELQRENDRKCQEFAKLVNGFSAWISENKDAIAHSTADLPTQLAQINERISNVPRDGARIGEIEAASRALEEAGITSNKHTNLQSQDVKVQWEQYQALLAKKRAGITEEIELAKLQGLTPQQVEEIRSNFAKYDKDHSGSLDAKELRALLYSLGEELSHAEVKKILAEFGDGHEKMTLEGFTKYMIKNLGDSDTREQTLTSFRLINKGLEYGKEDLLRAVLKNSDVDYLVKEAPHSAQGLDYAAWTEAVYSR